MEGCNIVKVPPIVAKFEDGDIEGDWNTIGVVVDKLPPKDSESVKVSMHMHTHTHTHTNTCAHACTHVRTHVNILFSFTYTHFAPLWYILIRTSVLCTTG